MIEIISYFTLYVDFKGDNKYKKGKLLMNNINAITDNHTDNRINCELNHHGYPIQVIINFTIMIIIHLFL